MISIASRVLPGILFLATLPLGADPGQFEVAPGTGGRPRIASVPPLILRADTTGPRLNTEEQMWRSILALRAEVGGGADVGALEAAQFQYSDPVNGNLLLLFWEEKTFNPSGVNVYEDGSLLGKAEAIPEAGVPGVNNVGLTKRVAGPHTWKVEAEGTNAEAALTVLDVQPFPDPTNLKCQSVDFFDPETGGCGMDITWDLEPGEKIVDTISIFIDKVFQGTVNGATRSIQFVGVEPGTHLVTVRALVTESANSAYAGQNIETSCDITCEDVACNPVSPPRICQLEYGPAAADNVLKLEWGNGELPYALGVNVYADGTLRSTVPPPGNIAFIGDLGPGTRKLGLEGDCDVDGKSTVREQDFAVLTETPHKSPITGPIKCQFDEVESKMLVTWTNDDPSALIDVFATPEGSTVLNLLGTINGASTGVTINNSEATETITLIFFKIVNGFCYGSEQFSCSGTPSGTQYIQGVCNGEGPAPAITSAIFGLNHLFLGGPAPPCREACDADGSGIFDLTDMVYVLNFLFLSGPPPTLYGGPDPVCTTAGPEDDCEIANPACPL